VVCGVGIAPGSDLQPPPTPVLGEAEDVAQRRLADGDERDALGDVLCRVVQLVQQRGSRRPRSMPLLTGSSGRPSARRSGCGMPPSCWARTTARPARCWSAPSAGRRIRSRVSRSAASRPRRRPGPGGRTWSAPARTAGSPRTAPPCRPSPGSAGAPTGGSPAGTAPATATDSRLEPAVPAARSHPVPHPPADGPTSWPTCQQVSQLVADDPGQNEAPPAGD
jgi:hypothetical protein